MQTKTLSTLFRISMWWRIFYGLIRAVLGFILIKLIDVPFSDIFCNVMNYEVADMPANSMMGHINALLQAHELTVTGFVAAYLIFWGVLDTLLSICLLKHKWWAFPISLHLIGFFILYELFRLFHTHSLVLLTFILIDIFIFWVIWREYVDIEKKFNKHFTEGNKDSTSDSVKKA